MLVQLVYVSIATAAFSAEQLLELLEGVRPRNRERELTGMLLISGDNIVQALEGPADQVDRTFAAIEQDPRHTRVRALWREQVDHRTFTDWSMGFRELSPADAGTVEGFSDFLTTGSTDHFDVGSDPSIAALHAFRTTTA